MTTATATPSKVSTAAWSTAVIAAMGITPTKTNVANMQLWLHQEQANGSEWAVDQRNPLGVGGGGLSVAPDYGGVQGGIIATANLLKQPMYSSIKNALATNAPAPVFAAAVIQSPWSGGVYAAKGINYFLGRGPLSVDANGNTVAGTHIDTTAVSTANPTGLVGQLLNDIPGYSAAHSVVSGVSSTAGGAAKILGDLSSASFWKRVGIFAAGGTLVLGGVVLFVVTSKGGQKAIETATGAAGAAAVL